jgi:hypothetical protein
MNEFFAMFFEFFGTVTCNATNDLFGFVYVPGGFLWLLATLFWVALYYQGFIVYRKKARWDTRGSWLLWMFISAILTTLSVCILTISQFNNANLIYGFFDYIEFLSLVFFWSLIAYFIFSIGLKFTNASRRKTPF